MGHPPLAWLGDGGARATRPSHFFEGGGGGGGLGGGGVGFGMGGQPARVLSPTLVMQIPSDVV